MRVTIIKATNTSHLHKSSQDEESMIKIVLLEGDLKLR